jgi:hypothetical protein
MIVEDSPEALILRIDGIRFADRTTWGKAPELPDAPARHSLSGFGRVP